MKKIKLSKIYDCIMQAVYPERCSVCGKLAAENESLCEGCKKLLSPIPSALCHRCGVSLRDHFERRCDDMPDPVIAAFYYGGSARKLIIDLKKRKSKLTFNAFAPFFFEKIKEEYGGVTFDTAVSVPSYRRGLFRTATPSELIARCTAEHFDLNYDRDILLKIKETEKQHRLNMKERMINLSGSVIYNKKKLSLVEGKTVLLCDDVKTTGSTLRECAKQLYGAGAKQVYCACLCVSEFHIV